MLTPDPQDDEDLYPEPEYHFSEDRWLFWGSVLTVLALLATVLVPADGQDWYVSARVGTSGIEAQAGRRSVHRARVLQNQPTPPATGFPTEATTGYPSGQSFTDLTLDVDGTAHAVTTDDTVLNGVHVAGDLLIRASNVTIRNSWIEGSVYNDWAGVYKHYEISDSTLTHTPGINSFNCNVQPGLLWSNYVARRVKVLGHDDGFRYTEGGPVDIQDSFWRGCWVDETVSPPDGSHSGGIQAQCTPGTTCGQLTLVHNNFDNDQRCVAPLVPPCFDIPAGELIGNSGISVQSFSGNVVDGPVLVQNNLVSGGGYTMPIWWFGGSSDYVFTDNRIVEGQYSFGPVDGVGCAHQTWTGNTLVTLVDEVNYAIASTVRSVDCSG